MSRRRLALRLALERRWQALYWRIVAAQPLDAEALAAADTLKSEPLLDRTSEKRASTRCW